MTSDSEENNFVVTDSELFTLMESIEKSKEKERKELFNRPINNNNNSPVKIMDRVYFAPHTEDTETRLEGLTKAVLHEKNDDTIEKEKFENNSSTLTNWEEKFGLKHRCDVWNNTIKGDNDFKKLCECLKKNYTLKELCIAENDIGQAGCTLLSEALIENNSLTWLEFFYTKNVSGKISHISNTLEKNTTLETLRFSSIVVSIEDCKSISDSLKKNNTLKTLCFWNCNIDDDGCGYISDMVQNNHSIRDLSFSGNKISDKGAEYIANMLENDSSHIKYLNIATNIIGNDGFKIILEALRTNSHLEYLNVYENNITQLGISEIHNILDCSTHLRQLRSTHGFIHNVGLTLSEEKERRQENEKLMMHKKMEKSMEKRKETDIEEERKKDKVFFLQKILKIESELERIETKVNSLSKRLELQLPCDQQVHPSHIEKIEEEIGGIKFDLLESND